MLEKAETFTYNSGLNSKKIGELFLEKRLITPEQLQEALEYQKKGDGRLGWILASLGYVKRLDFYRILAEHYQLEFETDIEKLIKEVDIKFIKQFNFEKLLYYEAIPARLDEEVLLVYSSSPGTYRYNEFISYVSNFCTFKKVKCIVITDLDLIKILKHFFGKELIDKAVNGLFYLSPEMSAVRVFTKSQLIFIYVLLLLFVFGIYFKPIITLTIANFFVQFFYVCINLFKFVVSLAGTFTEIEFKVEDELVKKLDDKKLPVYTILLPVYKETEVIKDLIEALKKMDYPLNKLDVLFLVEEDDVETLQAIKEAKPPLSWRIIIIPNSLPKTKPKACNYGVFFARGEYFVIYDAEDQPDPDQLKKAIVAFNHSPEEFICFQAALNYFNQNTNFLTRMFTLEYSYWFDYMLPGLHRLKMIIPLGGTSNHFKLNKLREIGAWDPFNVTEDADLGVRAFAKGYKVGVINSTTWEEANSRIKNWIRQRSRWIKGYMQTYLVHSRNPIKLYKQIGLRGLISFNLLIGGTPFMFLVNPIMWFLFIYWLITKTYALEPIFPSFVLYMAIFNLLFGNFLAIYLSMLSVFKRKFYNLLPYALLNPVYWILHSIASYLALYELFTKPFYWQKTVHGLVKK